MEKALLQRLAEAKANDAELLAASRRWASAYYLAGYAVELALKAVIADRFEAGVIPDKTFVLNIYTHDLAKLMNLSGLKDAFEAAALASPELSAQWSVVLQWSEHARYDFQDEQQATSLLHAIGDLNEGVLSWIARHW